MNLGPYTLFDIIDAGGVQLLQVTDIILNIEKKLNHVLVTNDHDLGAHTLDKCKKHNDEQVIYIFQSLEEVKKLLDENPFSTKRKNQLEYLSNTLDHFVNWYGTNDLQLPQKLSLMEWSKGSFSANKDFSIINVDNKSFRLRRNQSKVVGLLFNNLTNALDGLSYRDMVRETDLTRSGKLSNYFKGSPRVGDLFNYSRRTGKYSLKY